MPQSHPLQALKFMERPEKPIPHCLASGNLPNVFFRVLARLRGSSFSSPTLR
jgi:hypothetical protein